MLEFLALLFGGCPSGFAKIDFQDQKVCVMRDYYQVDGVRTPLTYPEALAIAEEKGWDLPTPDLVDAIWNAADLKLTPLPMTPDETMASESVIITHDYLIDQQIGGRKFDLVAGHKKDVVQQQMPGRVTIYGWHRTNGSPIQPVSSVHSEWYYDYSHGIRFVKFLN